LRVVTLKLPALRERKADLPLLIDHFIAELAQAHGRAVRSITPEARALLQRYDWPGNVRELRNVIENMVVTARGDVLTVEDVPDQVQPGAAPPASRVDGFELAGRSLADVERALIVANLELTEGNREKTARILGMGERTLYRKLKEYGLT
jgi:two-component system response regulator HydG